MEYLTGKDYDYLCTVCQTVIDMCVDLMPDAPDEYTSDEEGPLMLAGDQQMLCGRFRCDNRPDPS